MEGLGQGREEDSWDDDSAGPSAGTRVPAPQPTRKNFPVTKSAQTDDQELPSFPTSD